MSASGRAGFRLLRLETAAGLPALAELLVPADSPIFAGHFPGRPLVPGVAHLTLLRLVLDELAARGGRDGGDGGADGDGAGFGAAIVEVQSLRWRRPVAPGDRLALRLQAADDTGAFRFEVRRLAAAGPPEGELASSGTVRTGRAPEPGATTTWPAALLSPPLRLADSSAAQEPDLAGGFPPVAGLLPHAPPARLLTAVLAAGADGIVCCGAVPDGHPLATGGEAPGFLALELAAQAAAAGEALARHPGRRPRIGYLARVRGVHLAPTLPTGRTLRVTAVPAGSAAALATYDMQVDSGDGGERLAAGALSTFLPDL